MLLVVFTVEQGKGVISGIELARKISEFVLSPEFFLPVLILIFIYAIAYFSVHIAKGQLSYWSVILYLFLSSLIVYLVQARGDVTVSYVLVKVRDENANLYACEYTENGMTLVDYRCEIPPADETKAVVSDVPYVVDLFSFFDPILKGIYIASLSLDKVGQETLDREACTNPEKLFAYALTYPFAYLFENYNPGSEEACLHSAVKGFTGVLREDLTENGRVKQNAGEIVWEKLNSFRIPVMLNLCAIGRTLGAGNVYWYLVKRGLEERLSECSNVLSVYDADRMRDAVKDYAVTHGTRYVENFFTLFLPQVENVGNTIAQVGTAGLVNFGNAIQEGVKWVSVFMNKTFNYGFLTKFTLLSNAQGVVMGLILGLSPLIFVLSLIPVGGRVINWGLLLGYMLAYFLVSLWIPVLYMIYVIVWGRAVLSFMTGG